MRFARGGSIPPPSDSFDNVPIIASKGYAWSPTMTQPKPGDYFLCEIQGSTAAGRTHLWVQAGQWIIDGTKSPWSHAGMVIDGGRTVEAMPGGAVFGWVGEVVRHPHVFSSWSEADGLTDEKRAELVISARRYAEPDPVGYSFLDYSAIGLHSRGIDAAWLRDYIGDTGHMLCSQMVDDWYTQAGLHPFPDHRWPGYVKPSDLGHTLTGPLKAA